ncbi:hypothetical protein C5C03_00265 [Clavibacter michiganensis]|nr:hypothetical protein C5C03_00265 [Clavibacter michiganensis]PPF99336.1 hypothetical protein C5C05_02070 [Clavibacter michiganensis]
MPASSASAAPGSPGTPGDPPTLFTEDFENQDTTNVQTLGGYTGADGTTYAAEGLYADSNECNSLLLSPNSNYTGTQCTNGSNATANKVRLKDMVGQLGQLNGTGNANNAISAMTANEDVPANTVEFKTTKDISLPTANGRFITFGVNVAAACGDGGANFKQPRLAFSLVDSSGNETAATDSPVNPCDGATSGIRTKKLISDKGILFSGTTVGIKMRNVDGGGKRGNDHAFDDIKILDVTPQLDKSFSPALQRTGDNSTLTFTVTNTSELGSKDGWTFKDKLPNGLKLASSTVGGTCSATTTATEGGDTIDVTKGKLNKGDKSCTITVQVTSATAGTYSNCPTTNVTVTGLDLPACANVEFRDAKYTTEKKADKTVVNAGDSIKYTVTVKNTGGVPYTAARPASFTDDLSKVTDDAVYNNDATEGAKVDGNTLSWSGALGANETKTITYSFKVNNPDAGDHQLDNAVTPNGSGGTCSTAADCVTHADVKSYGVTKSVDAEAVNPNETVTYTITVKNTGRVAYTNQDPASFTDDLSDVTDDATYNNDATDGAVIIGNTLTWSGPLAVGETVTIKYSFKVNNPDTGDKHLKNVVVPTGPGSSCDGPCRTDVPTRSGTVTKSADKTTANPGDVVTYTITLTNTGQAPYTTAKPAGFTDDISQVVDDAKFNDDISGGATRDGNTISWKGALGVNEVKTFKYSVTVDNPDTGDHLLKNQAVPTDPTWSTPPPVNIPVKEYKVEKSADTGKVRPGETVTYKITVTNTGRVDYTDSDPAGFSDDLSQVVDDAKYNGDIDGGATQNGNALSWQGALASGAAKTFTYTVTVNNPDTGDHLLKNQAIPQDPNIPPPPEVVVPVKDYEVKKSADTTSVKAGDTVTYTITVTNKGQSAYTDEDPAGFSDDLSKVLDDATYNDDVSGGATRKGNTLSWKGPLAIGEVKTFTYSVRVNTPDTGDHQLKNQAVPQDPSITPPPEVVIPVKEYKVEKTSDKPDAALRSGETVTYKITVTNTGLVDYTDQDTAGFSDDLSMVTDDATYNGDVTGGATVNGNTASWSGALAAGAAKEFTYSFTVNTPDTGDHHLKNQAVPNDPDFPKPPPVEHFVPTYAVSKSVDKTSAAAGDRVSYTITVTNTGQAAYTDEKPASFTDDLSQVVDDATYNGDASNGATVSGRTLSWKGALEVGETKTVTYSFTVNDPDTGDKKLMNAVVPTDPSGSCQTAGGCKTETNVVSDPPHFPTVSTGGTSIGAAQLWPMVGLAGGSVLVLLALLGLLMAGRRRDGDSV